MCGVCGNRVLWGDMWVKKHNFALNSSIDTLAENIVDKLIPLDGVDLRQFAGANNANIMLLRRGNPSVNVTLRGTWLKITGDGDSVGVVDHQVQTLLAYYNEHNTLPSETVEDVLGGKQVNVLPQDATIITYTLDGKPIRPRGVNQQRLVDAIGKSDMVFAVGPAGSGKTYVAIALAVGALKARQVRKIILSRPAVEAGEKLGFLPGDMKEKIDPYLQPLYDALGDMLPQAKLREMIEDGTIEIAPLAFMRGRTLSNAFVILDEAQNATMQQIKMFLTRMGANSKYIITGDPSQADLPDAACHALDRTCRILRGVEGIETVEFSQEDIVRHRLVQRIVTAFSKAESRSK